MDTGTDIVDSALTLVWGPTIKINIKLFHRSMQGFGSKQRSAAAWKSYSSLKWREAIQKHPSLGQSGNAEEAEDKCRFAGSVLIGTMAEEDDN
jgi:hypothetical protein